MSKESVAAAAKKFHEAARTPLARLAQIATEQEQAYVEKYGSAGDGRAKPVMAVPHGVQEERGNLRRQLSNLAAQAKTVAWSAAKDAQDALTAARLSQVGDDAGRMADLLAADQMSKTADPEVLVRQAWQALQAGDVRAASVRYQAAKLAPKPPRPMVTNPLAKEIEAMLDEAVPARKAALEAHQATHKQALDLTVAANKAEMDAANLAGDVAAGAGISVNLKTAEYFASKA